MIDGLLTSPVVIERLVEFASALGYTPVKARDTPGFIVNHAGRGYGTEALRIIGEGVADAATIDLILKLEAGFRMGPFELLDLTGLDVSHPVMESIYHQFYEEPRFRPSPLTAQRLAAGLLGRKSGRGFYDYRGVDTLTRPSISRRQSPKATRPRRVAPGSAAPVQAPGNASSVCCRVSVPRSTRVTHRIRIRFASSCRQAVTRPPPRSTSVSTPDAPSRWTRCST